MRTVNKPVRAMTRDELVKAVTAFPSFEEMEYSMREHGYRPTLRGFVEDGVNRVRAKQQRRWNEMVNRLRAEVVKAGYGYFARGRHVPPLAEQVHKVR
jgi:hypothetical protein